MTLIILRFLLPLALLFFGVYYVLRWLNRAIREEEILDIASERETDDYITNLADTLNVDVQPETTKTKQKNK